MRKASAKDARLVKRTVNEHVHLPGAAKLELESVPLGRIGAGPAQMPRSLHGGFAGALMSLRAPSCRA